MRSWREELGEWIDEQHGSAGWESKLEKFVGRQRALAKREVVESLQSGEYCICDCCGKYKPHEMMGTCDDCI